MAQVLPRQEKPQAPAILERYRALLDHALRQGLSSLEGDLRTMLHYHMGWADPGGQAIVSAGGKALRPALCLFLCEAVGGQAERAVPAAVAVELVHNFSLIHDDIQDADRERRHRPTLWSLWGQSRALVAGNTLRTRADQALLHLEKSGCSSRRVRLASCILTQGCLEMIEGQYLDLQYEHRLDVTPEAYLEMVSKKTGALMECSAHLGALLGTEDQGQVEALRRCGRLLGLAFQVQDDVLGVWGEEAVTGKPIGADIYRKKKSFPVVYALHQTQGPWRQRLTRLYTRGAVGEAEVAEVLEVLEAVGARAVAGRVAEEKRDAALDWVRKAALPRRAQKELEELASFVTHRQH